MSKKTKIWLITASCVAIVGLIIFAGVMTAMNWDFTKLSTVKYETNTHEITEEFKGIKVDTNTADIIFKSSEDSVCRVVCREETKHHHEVSVVDSTLKIELKKDKRWYEYIGINIGSQKITVYLPKGVYGDLSVKANTGDIDIPADFSFENIDIKTNTGNVGVYASAKGDVKIKTNTGGITLEGISATDLDLSVNTGKTTLDSLVCDGDITLAVSTGKTILNDVKGKSLTSKGNTGSITLTDVILSKKLSIKRGTGNVKLEKCDAAEMYIETDTGDVKGSLCSDKVFITETDTGSIKVPESTNGGKCKIKTDTGDIKITVE